MGHSIEHSLSNVMFGANSWKHNGVGERERERILPICISLRSIKMPSIINIGEWSFLVVVFRLWKRSYPRSLKKVGERALFAGCILTLPNCHASNNNGGEMIADGAFQLL
jgi:hypothetical protein